MFLPASRTVSLTPRVPRLSMAKLLQPKGCWVLLSPLAAFVSSWFHKEGTKGECRITLLVEGEMNSSSLISEVLFMLENPPSCLRPACGRSRRAPPPRADLTTHQVCSQVPGPLGEVGTLGWGHEGAEVSFLARGVNSFSFGPWEGMEGGGWAQKGAQVHHRMYVLWGDGGGLGQMGCQLRTCVSPLIRSLL